MVIRQVGVWSVARMYGILSAAGGLLMGLLFACIALVGAGIGPRNQEMPSFIGAAFGVGAVIIFRSSTACLASLPARSGGPLQRFAGMVGGTR